MKRIVFIVVFLSFALQLTDADARSRRNRHEKQQVLTSYVLLYGGINSRPDADITLTGG